jgi:hypothetical protein
MSLNNVYNMGRQDALQKFAQETPSPADALIAAIDQAPDGPPPSEQMGAPMPPNQLPGVPPEIAAQPLPSTMQPPVDGETPSMDDPMRTQMNLGKEAAINLQQLLFLEREMGKEPVKDMLSSIDRQMSGRGGGQSGTLSIGPNGREFTARPKPPPMAAPRPTTPSIGAQAAEHVITSAPRIPPGVRAS